MSLFLILFCLPGTSFAYIGPGAGFALISSALTLFVSLLLSLLTLLTLPFRLLRLVFRALKRPRSSVDRVILLGFDGLDPKVCENMMAAGELPHLSGLKNTGSFRKLETTRPAISPVAWSTFATGVGPARHRIFDFIRPNPETCLPELSSARFEDNRSPLRLGDLVLSRRKAVVQFLRKSKSFWTVLGEHGIFSHIIRVPITFPPEKFYGAMLSAMCLPDVRGTQGTYTYYTSQSDRLNQPTGGEIQLFEQSGETCHGRLLGPDFPLPGRRDTLSLEVSLHPEQDKQSARLEIGNRSIRIKENQWTPWISVIFHAGWGVRVHGLCQCRLMRGFPNPELYISPVHVDPAKPAFPVSWPVYFSSILGKRFGPYATLGLAEDTWALNEGVLDDEAFLDQAESIHAEREKQFFHALDKTRKGVCACVFDLTDRIQHMFYRYQDSGHPAGQGECTARARNAIPDVYRKADSIVGDTLKRMKDKSILIVLSDHGFTTFRRGVNLNTWLQQEGYLALRPNQAGGKYLQNVDWTRTRAYALGLAGIYLNRTDREHRGTVNPGEEASLLKSEIGRRLLDLIDPETGEPVISQITDSEKELNGPYSGEAPDLIVGFKKGYRASWDCASGITADTVFEDNNRPWSGDHCVDTSLVPGVLFCSRPLLDEKAHIADIAPTVLNLFGVSVPAYMEGRPLQFAEEGP